MEMEAIARLTMFIASYKPFHLLPSSPVQPTLCYWHVAVEGRCDIHSCPAVLSLIPLSHLDTSPQQQEIGDWVVVRWVCNILLLHLSLSSKVKMIHADVKVIRAVPVYFRRIIFYNSDVELHVSSNRVENSYHRKLCTFRTTDSRGLWRAA